MIVTVEPRGAVPPLGDCDCTRPSWLRISTSVSSMSTLKPRADRRSTAASRVSPVTPGTLTSWGSSGSAATVMVTVEPAAT